MNTIAFYKTKQFFFVLIKLSLVLGAFYFIYHKLTQNETLNFYTFVDFVTTNAHFSLSNIALLVILSSINWVLEIKKWQMLVSSFSKIDFATATKQTLGAFTASILTPNRIGDYGAKALYYKPKDRTKIVLLNLFGNTTQMAVTVFFGIIGLAVLATNYNLPIQLDYILIIGVSFLIILIAIYGVLRFSFLKTLKSKFHNLYLILKHLKLDIKLKTLTLSLMRYLVFSFQFYILLLFFGLDLSYLVAMVFITTMYILSSVIPSIFIFDVVIKSSVAVYLFSFINTDALPILCTTTLLWILNFVLPSGIGSYFVLSFKPVQTK